jgi:hypothetical protein
MGALSFTACPQKHRDRNKDEYQAEATNEVNR